MIEYPKDIEAKARENEASTAVQLAALVADVNRAFKVAATNRAAAIRSGGE